MTNLKYIDLSFTNISNNIVRNIASHSTLEIVLLNNTLVNNNHVYTLSHNRIITTLNIANTNITPTIVKHLQCMSQLIGLDLSNNQFDDDSINNLYIDKLQLLKLDGNNISNYMKNSMIERTNERLSIIDYVYSPNWLMLLSFISLFVSYTNIPNYYHVSVVIEMTMLCMFIYEFKYIKCEEYISYVVSYIGIFRKQMLIEWLGYNIYVAIIAILVLQTDLVYHMAHRIKRWLK